MAMQTARSGDYPCIGLELLEAFKTAKSVNRLTNPLLHLTSDTGLFPGSRANL
jgi:hypothetical protein